MPLIRRWENHLMRRLRNHADILIERKDPLIRHVATLHCRELEDCIGAAWFRTAIADELRRALWQT